MSKSNLFETIFVYRVLSEGPIGDMDMSDVVQEADSGSFVGSVISESSIRRTKKEMVNLLYDAGSEPGFFSLEDADDTDSEHPSEVTIPVSKGRGTWVMVGRIPERENETLIIEGKTLSEAHKEFVRCLYDGHDESRASVKKRWGVEVYMDAEVRVDGLAAVVYP